MVKAMCGATFKQPGVGDPTFEQQRLEGRERFHDMTVAQRKDTLARITRDASFASGPEKVFAKGWLDEFQARSYRLDDQRPSIILKDYLARRPA